MAVAEKIRGKKWKWVEGEYKKPSLHNDIVPYYLEPSQLEGDIRVSLANTAAAEKKLGEWTEFDG